MSSVTVSEAKIVGRFTVALIVLTIVYLVVDLILDMFLGVVIPGNMMGILVAMCAALMAGDFYYKRTEQMPDKALCWRMAFLFTLVNLALAAAAFGGVALAASLWAFDSTSSDYGNAGYMMSEHEIFPLSEYWWVFVILFVFVAAVTLLACRWAFYGGAKSAKKYLENQAQKASRKSL